MDGIIFNIQRFAIHDGPGVRTTVFLKGCPLSCHWCHNPESISPEIQFVQKHYPLNGKLICKDEPIGYKIKSNDLIDELMKDLLLMDESNGGVTFSGGEPLMQNRFLNEMLVLCRDRNIHTAVDTTLYSNFDVIQKIHSYTNLFLVDLKLMDDVKHNYYTGVSNQRVLENIIRLSQLKQPFRIRIPLIPGITDTIENINDSVKFLCDIKTSVQGIDLLPFHNIAKAKYNRFNIAYRLQGFKEISEESVNNVKSIFESAGFNVKIGG
ncbi:MAG: glycyl-radical enzyme activating protein [Marinilabiliaceae bacterium]|nr:glycyl-radical enzyme activating protein [Marinilabiliaceae bacterium]